MEDQDEANLKVKSVVNVGKGEELLITSDNLQVTTERQNT